MDQREQSDLSKMLGNRQAMEQLTQSPDAQALASLLSQGHDRAQLEQMAQSAVSGDMQSLKALVKTVTDDPKSMDLLRRLSESFHQN